MSFFGHLKKLINTKVGEGISKEKDPAVAVRTLVRDMKTHLSGAQSALVVLRRDEQRLRLDLVKIDTESKVWLKKAQDALVAGNEPLARQCLRHKLAAVKCYREIETEHKKLVSNLAKLEKGISLLQVRLKEVTAREKAMFAKMRRIKRAEFLQTKFPQHKELALKMALEELDYDTERRLHASFLLEEDALDRKFRELEANNVAVDDELKLLKKDSTIKMKIKNNRKEVE
jgi:phage shock protein A